jgi:hypothetical protein
MSASRCLSGVCSLLCCLSLIGCSERLKDGQAIVHGKVVVDGESPAEGAIVFSPVDGQSPTSGGKIINGEYSVTAAIGKAKVAIRVPKVTGQQKLYDSPDAPLQTIKTESLPRKFNDETELVHDVVPGESTCNFELSTN